MSTIYDDVKGEALRRAVKWISEQKSYTLEGVGEASQRFDLSPVDEEFLIREFVSKREGQRRI
jgi:hypothetical protein